MGDQGIRVVVSTLSKILNQALGLRRLTASLALEEQDSDALF